MRPAIDGTRMWPALFLGICSWIGNHVESLSQLESEQVSCAERIGSVYWIDFSPLAALPPFVVQ